MRSVLMAPTLGRPTLASAGSIRVFLVYGHLLSMVKIRWVSRVRGDFASRGPGPACCDQLTSSVAACQPPVSVWSVSLTVGEGTDARSGDLVSLPARCEWVWPLLSCWLAGFHPTRFPRVRVKHLPLVRLPGRVAMELWCC